MKGSKAQSVRVRGRYLRRGAAAAMVAVSSFVLVGFAALSVDVGHLYSTRAELQRTADAAAMAAASQLADYTSGDPLTAARAAAQDMATRNTVLGAGLTLDNGRDIVFGRAVWNSTNQRYVFTPTESFSNAVRVTARRTSDSANGPVPLFFGRVFGHSTKDITATATAILTPRDIALVLDLSASHNDDTSLRSFRNIQIENRNVWSYLWDDALAVSQGATRPTDAGGAAGPYFGNMNTWGTQVTDPSWNFAADPGLVRLVKGANWSLNSAWVSQTLSAKGYGTYVSSEMTALNTQPSSFKSGDSADKYYRRRVRVALGLDRWKSGKSGGQSGGNGDNYIDASEVTSLVPYPSASSNPATYCKKVGGSWDSFVDYVASSSSSMCKYDPDSQLYGNPDLRYRFGLKTFVDFLQEKQVGTSTSPGLNGAPTQPMGAVADASRTLIEIIDSLDSNDLVGLASYGTVGYGPSDKPSTMSWLTDDLLSLRSRIDTLQAGMWSSTTNMAQGIDKGVDVLMNSAAARPYAAKVLLLLTDGKPNQTRANPTEYYDELCQTCPPRDDARAAAQDAVAQGIRIYAISVGANCDLDLMEEIAAIGRGSHFHAEGSVASYSAQLQEIFQNLGGRRPVSLIQ